MSNKILIIGLGSIGQRHYDILKKFNNVSEIRVISNRKPKKIRSIEFNKTKLVKYNPDYIIISSKTSQHYSHLKKINSIFRNKIILVEKPLFHKKMKIKKIKNKIFVGYNMRFKPIIEFLKKIVNLEKNDYLLSANVYCGSYLPNWRDNIHYSKSNSAFKKLGGGVLNDLSHEIDYMHWLFGKLKKKYSVLEKKSKLRISSEDTYSLLGRVNNIKKSIININLNYYSKISHRFLILDFENKTIHADLINDIIKIKYINKKEIQKKFVNVDRNFSYIRMHKSILNKKYKNLCSFKQGLEYLT